MLRPRTTFVLVALAALAPLGCGGGQGGAVTEGQKTSARATAPSQTPAPHRQAGGGPTVSMRNNRYIPSSVTVRSGQTVRWTNDDAVAHTVTATSGAQFDSGTIEAGDHYEYKPTSAGRISYYCTIHGRQQSGTITVR